MELEKYEPQNKATLAAGNGAVFIATPDKNFIVLAPDTARQIAKHLPSLADLAEKLKDHEPEKETIHV